MAPLQLEISLVGFLPNDNAFLTKSGDVGVILECPGIDPESKSNAEINVIGQRFENALRVLDERTVLHQYYLRREMDHAPDFEVCGNAILDEANRKRAAHLERQGLYQESIYYCLVVLDPRALRGLWQALKQRRLRSHFMRRRFQELIRSEVVETRELLERRLTDFSNQFQDIMPLRVMPYQECYRVLWTLLNLRECEEANNRIERDDFLDYKLADSFVGPDKEWIKVQDNYAVGLALKDLPLKSSLLMLSELRKLRGSFHLAMTWNQLAPGEDRRRIKRMKKHFHRGRHSGARALGIMSGPPSPLASEQLTDDEKLEHKDQLSEIQRRFGRAEYSGIFSLNVMAYGSTLKQAKETASDVQRVFTKQGAKLIVDKHSQLNRLLTSIPGSYKLPQRELMIMNTHLADLALWEKSLIGERHNSKLNAECLAVLRTNDLTPYWFNFHGSAETNPEIAHTLVMGDIRSGKTTIAAWSITQLQKYRPFTLIFDVGGGYAGVTKAFGGSHIKLSAERQDIKINPFAFELTPARWEFLDLFVTMLAESSGDKLTGPERDELHKEIGAMYEFPSALRSLGYLVQGLSKELGARLKQWVAGGRHGSWFDNIDDTVTMNDFQYLDFSEEISPEVMAAVLFYVFHRADEVVLDPHNCSKLKAFFIDEGWRFVQSQQVCDYLITALKGWPKHNGFVVLLTHAVDDLRDSKVMRRLISSTHTKMFLSSPGVDGDYKEVFHMRDEHVEVIRNLKAREELLLVKDGVVKKLSTCLDPFSLALVNTGKGLEAINEVQR